MPTLTMHLLGSPRFVDNGSTLTIGRRKVVALLAYLAYTNRSHTRETLATMLWPEYDQSNALKNLRRDLSRLKRLVGEAVLLVDRTQIGLHPEADIWVDVIEFKTKLQFVADHNHFPEKPCQECLTAVSQAVDLYSDDFMTGFTVPDSPEFDDWQFFERETLRQTYAGALQKLVDWHVAQGEYTQGIEYGRLLLNLDLLHEPAQRQLMRLYAWSGQQSAAQRQYQECVRILEQELGVKPEAETTALHTEIRARRLASPDLQSQAVEKERIAALELLPPESRYQVEKLLAQGDHGEIYLGVDTATGRPVVIKQLPSDLKAKESEAMARFMQEAEALRQLNHPNIVGILATYERNGRPAIVLEYVAGGSLRQLIDAEAPLGVAVVIEIALELADALGRAHHLKILHRDIKPENILLAADGTPRLSDFGLARLERGEDQLTQPGTILGSPAYLSPEALRGETLDARSDIWSFGVLLYEMLTGKRPFSGQQIGVVLTNILTEPLPDITQFNPAIPLTLKDLLGRMLAKDRKKRIAGMRLVAAELETLRVGSLNPPQSITDFAHDVQVPDEAVWASIDFDADDGFVIDAVNDDLAVVPASTSVNHNLPTPATTFVGRERDLIELRELLADPDVHLVTLFGPGGIGKTRLSLQVAHGFVERPLPTFADGIWFVPLAPLHDLNEIITSLAQLFLLSSNVETEQLQQQLLDYMRPRQLLLLFDNFEHIHFAESVRLIADILAHAPKVTVLVSSRERLNIQGERLFSVTGLEIPQTASLSQTQADALQLFEQSARRSHYDFCLTAENLPDVIHICRLVQGMPLGIELATAWVDLLSPAEIVQEIEQNLDFLESELADMPERQRSLRAVFDSSWNLLTEADQTTLVGLTVFNGGFSREAARRVAAASVMSLRSLVHKSWLYAVTDGRFQIHPLLRQYGAEKLAKTAQFEPIHSQHTYYYGQLANSLVAGFNSENQKEILAQIETEIENLRVGWQWLCDHHSAEDAWVNAQNGYLNAFFHFFDTRSRFQEGEKIFATAVAQIQTLPAAAKDLSWEIIQGKLKSRQGWFAFHMGRHEQAVALLQESVATLSAQNAQTDVVFALNYLGAVQRHLGEFTSAQRNLEESLRICEQIGDQFGRTVALNILGQIAYVQGVFAQAAAYCQQSLAIKRMLGDRWGMTFSLLYLGTISMAQGDYDAAQQYFGESMQISETLDDPRGAATSLSRQGEIAVLRHNYDQAIILYNQSLAIFESIHNPLGILSTRTRLGDLACVQGESEVAWQHVHTALLSWRGLQVTPDLLDTLTTTARLWQMRGNVAQSEQLFVLIYQHPATRQESRAYAWQQLEKTGVAAVVSRQQDNTSELDKAVNNWIENILQ